MQTRLHFKRYRGELEIPSSKSELHRLLFIASLAAMQGVKDEIKVLYRGKLCRDVLATIGALRALGSDIRVEKDVIRLSNSKSRSQDIDVSESGTTLRFLVPRIGLYGQSVNIKMQGRLAQRPMDDFTKELEKKGMSFEKEGDVLRVRGTLCSGEYTLPGSVSSQYISSLLLTLPFLEGDSVINIKGKLESYPYVKLTTDFLESAGVRIRYTGDKFYIDGMSKVRQSDFRAYGDYSSATFFACIGALSKGGIYIKGLDISSSQGDSRIFSILDEYGAFVEKRDEGYFVQEGDKRSMEVDASDIPDMVMALSVIMSCATGESRIKNCSRLRLKESDRIHSTLAMLKSFGVNAHCDEDDIIIKGPSVFRSAVVDSFNDHRIAMAASVFSAVSPYDIVINKSECVEKSYPDFFSDLKSLEEDYIINRIGNP